MKRYIEQEQVEIAPHPYIYRVVHRIMEGDCKMDHGPLLITGGGFLADNWWSYFVTCQYVWSRIDTGSCTTGSDDSNTCSGNYIV